MMDESIIIAAVSLLIMGYFDYGRVSVVAADGGASVYEDSVVKCDAECEGGDACLLDVEVEVQVVGRDLPLPAKASRLPIHTEP